jgi:hypothetical protein
MKCGAIGFRGFRVSVSRKVSWWNRVSDAAVGSDAMGTSDAAVCVKFG